MTGEHTWTKFDTALVWVLLVGAVLCLLFGDDKQKDFGAGVLFVAAVIGTMYSVAVGTAERVRDNRERRGHR